MPKTAYFGQNLAVFGPKILISTGGNREMGGTTLFEPQDAESPFGNQLNKRPVEYTRSHHSGV